MGSNFIITEEGVTLVPGYISSCEYLISKEDLDLLVKDSECRKEFLKSLQKTKIIVSHLGDNLDENFYVKSDKNLLKVGANKWK